MLYACSHLESRKQNRRYSFVFGVFNDENMCNVPLGTDSSDIELHNTFFGDLGTGQFSGPCRSEVPNCCIRLRR